MLTGEQERLEIIMVALDYSIKHVSETKRSLRESLTAGKMTAPLTLLEQFDTDLDALSTEVRKLRNEIELALANPAESFSRLKLDGASKDILSMGLGMYELELKQTTPVGGIPCSDNSAGTRAKLRIIEETKRALGL